MIEYVEIRDAQTREFVGVVDAFISLIWETDYYGAGFIEIYTPATASALQLLRVGNYCTRPNIAEAFVLENVRAEYDEEHGRVLIATGRGAVSILDRRIIYTLSGTSVTPTILRGNVEAAARKIVQDNAIACKFDSGRNMAELKLGGLAGITDIIRDENGAASEKQTTYSNLFEFAAQFLQEYHAGQFIEIDAAQFLAYNVYKGTDRSVDNTDGRPPVLFSQEYDNLGATVYEYQTADVKTTALIGGEGEGVERFCVLQKDANTGSARREMFIDASSSSREYKDDAGETQTLTAAEYRNTLLARGLQELATRQPVETFTGEIILDKQYKYGRGLDLYLGDVVTIQDNGLGLYINTRIIKATEVQDESGYRLRLEYGGA